MYMVKMSNWIVRNQFAKFCFEDTTLKDESRRERPSDLKQSFKGNIGAKFMSIKKRYSTKIEYITINCLSSFEKLGKISKLRVWISHLSEWNKKNFMSPQSVIMDKNRVFLRQDYNR